MEPTHIKSQLKSKGWKVTSKNTGTISATIGEFGFVNMRFKDDIAFDIYVRNKNGGYNKRCRVTPLDAALKVCENILENEDAPEYAVYTKDNLPEPRKFTSSSINFNGRKNHNALNVEVMHLIRTIAVINICTVLDDCSISFDVSESDNIWMLLHCHGAYGSFTIVVNKDKNDDIIYYPIRTSRTSNYESVYKVDLDPDMDKIDYNMLNGSDQSVVKYAMEAYASSIVE